MYVSTVKKDGANTEEVKSEKLPEAEQTPEAVEVGAVQLFTDE